MNELLTKWAQRNGVSRQAMYELYQLMMSVDTNPPRDAGSLRSEAAAQNVVRLEASKKGLRLWRNNVGAAIDSRGNSVRFGLCNDSPRMNKVIKSADLIGIRPVMIEMHHVGHIIGQFVAREIKRPGWQFSGTAHEKAQLTFLELVTAMGGDAKFATGEGTL